MPLTDTAIRAAKPSDKPRKLSDGAGLYLEISPAGGKWWRLKYRFGGKEKRISLGTYPDTGLKDARARCSAARKLLAAGIDPSADRKANREATRTASTNTLESVARAWLLHREDAWAEGTREAITSALERDAFAEYGALPITDIRPADVRAMVQAVEARGARESAGRLFQRLKAVFRYAASHDLLAVDPSYSLRPGEMLKRQRIKHRAALEEREVPAYLQRLAAYGGDPTVRAALRLLMLTAVRPGELRGARWDEFDSERKLWRIPAERMKMKTEHLVPLSRQALDVLKELRPLTGSGVLVFPSPFYPSQSFSENTLNSALARMGYKGIATAHGFRSLFSTCANEAEWNSDVIERQLAHEERDDVRAAYNRAGYLKERTKLMQWWADKLDSLGKMGNGDGPLT
jgi:integrase